MNSKFAFLYTVFLFLTSLTCTFAQSGKFLRGAVLQDGTKERIERVEITNPILGYRIYSDRFGLFEIPCQIGDTILFELIGYQTQKIAVKDYTSVLIKLKLTNQLKEVNISGKLASRNYQDISNAYSREKGIFYGGKPPLRLLLPIGGSPLTFFHELLGKDGRRVRRLNKLSEQAANAEEIGRYFNDLIIQQTVSIDSADLDDFKLKYTPGLEALKKWSSYQRAIYIQSSFNEFRKRNKN